MASAATSIVFEGQIEVPLNMRSLADFRQWALSDDFPETGRIDFIAGRIEVDMAPEDFFSHGGVKTEFTYVLTHRVKQLRIGYLRIDRTRISSPEGDLSAEPDIALISHETLSSGRADCCRRQVVIQTAMSRWKGRSI